MSYPKNIVQLRPTRGISVDIPPSEVGPEFYTFGDNVHFRDGFAQRTIGEQRRYDPPLTNMRNLRNMISDAGRNFWVYSGDDSISVVEGATHSDITPAGGLSSVASPDDFTAGLLGGVLHWNNGTDAPYWWDSLPTNPLTALPGWIVGDTCRALRHFKYHLFALDMTEAVGGQLPMKLKWSAAAEPGAIPTSWTPTASNDAGDTQLSDTPGAIIDAAPLRGGFIIYKNQSTYLCDYVGGQFVFNFRRLFATSGVLGRNCIAEYNGRHYVLSDDDIIIHDGNQMKSLLDKRARRRIFAALDSTNFRNAFVLNYERRKEMWFCIPEAGETFASSALIYNIEEDAWSQRDLVQAAHGDSGIITEAIPDQSWDARIGTWDLATDIWDQQVFSGADDALIYASTDEVTPVDSRLVGVDEGSDFDGVPINCHLQKLEMSFEEPDQVKIVKRCWPKVIANDGVVLSIRVGGSMEPDSPISWSAPVSFTKGAQERVDLFAQGKYISFEATSDGGAPWTMTGFDMEMELRGYF